MSDENTFDMTQDSMSAQELEKRPKILIVDDDTEIRDLLVKLLEKHGYKTVEAENGASMLEILARNSIDLILLDILMEGDDGLVLCKKIRETSTIPVIIISAIGEPVDKILGLELGADDYIVKPFYSREVISRIKALLRRCKNFPKNENYNPSNCKIHFAGWTLQTQNRRLFDPQGIEVSLSVSEYFLLESLINHANRIVSRDQLLSYIHDYSDQDVFDRSIDVQICRLRKRIENNPKQPELIKTIRSGGYMFEAKIEKS